MTTIKAVRGHLADDNHKECAPTARTKAGKAGHLVPTKQELPNPPGRAIRALTPRALTPSRLVPSPRTNGVSDHIPVDSHTWAVATPSTAGGGTHNSGFAPPATNDAGSGQARFAARTRPARSGTNSRGRGQSTIGVQTTSAAPAESTVGEGHAGTEAQAIHALPDHSTLADGGGGGHRIRDTQTHAATDPAVPAIIEPYLRRRAVIKFRVSLTNQLSAYARSMLGYRSTDGDEKARKAIVKRAAALVSAVLKGKPTDEPPAVVLVVADMAKLAKPSIDAMNAEQKRLETIISEAVSKLRVYPWATAIRGFGDMGLASVVGECGDLSNYANPAKVWKRMGLAVMDGKRQGAPGDKATAEDWIAHGYSKYRRSVAWNIGEPIIKHNGAYKALYDKRKKLEITKLGAPEGEPCGHANNRAKRWMVKRLLRDLWREWRKHGT